MSRDTPVRHVAQHNIDGEAGRIDNDDRDDKEVGKKTKELLAS